jgi:hypothetical protein
MIDAFYRRFSVFCQGIIQIRLVTNHKDFSPSPHLPITCINLLGNKLWISDTFVHSTPSVSAKDG